MTIQFHGHVESVKRAGIKQIDVHIVAPSAVCEKGITLTLPEADAAHWLVGRVVQITAHAYDANNDAQPAEPHP